MFSTMAQPVSRLVHLGPSVHRAWLTCSFGIADRSQALVSLPVRRGSSQTHKLQDIPGDTSSSDKVLLQFINRDGEKLPATAKEGESLLEVVMNQNLNIDGFGACEGTLACSTCHLIFEEDAFKKLDVISDEELDMLDLAFGLTDTSRLGCQVCIKKWMDGMSVQVPTEASDIRRELEAEKKRKQ
ncbi:adrenodoxin-like [Elgaria multicarinata webbii]|uniref:adrenodoxin-like n=1 Tax=Elgaria multicarinata webbii TaxID=159646 RepID=UPI002FCCD4B9